MATFQEMPPKGGYPTHVQWKRNLPSRGFRPSIWFWGSVAICSYGFYIAAAGVRERNELTRERNWSRFHIQPLLEAESDRDKFRRLQTVREYEAKAMEGVEDFDVEKSVYNDGKFRMPTYLSLPKV